MQHQGDRHWRPNTDGVDIVNSSYVTVRDSFLRTFDDTVTLKGIDRYQHLNVEHISVQNCVLWCGWGADAGNRIGNGLPLRAKRRVQKLRSHPQFRRLHGYSERRLRRSVRRPLRGHTGGISALYPGRTADARARTGIYGKKGAVPSLIEMNNFRFREHYKGFPKNDTVYENSFTVHDITFRNIKIFPRRRGETSRPSHRLRNGKRPVFRYSRGRIVRERQKGEGKRIGNRLEEDKWLPHPLRAACPQIRLRSGCGGPRRRFSWQIRCRWERPRRRRTEEFFIKTPPPLGISGGADCFMRAEKFRTARFSGVFRSVRNRCGRLCADGGGRSNRGS